MKNECIRTTSQTLRSKMSDHELIIRSTAIAGGILGHGMEETVLETHVDRCKGRIRRKFAVEVKGIGTAEGWATVET
jgi:hypothetical protein